MKIKQGVGHLPFVRLTEPVPVADIAPGRFKEHVIFAGGIIQGLVLPEHSLNFRQAQNLVCTPPVNPVKDQHQDFGQRGVGGRIIDHGLDDDGGKLGPGRQSFAVGIDGLLFSGAQRARR